MMSNTHKSIIDEMERVEKEFVEARYQSRKAGMDKINVKRKAHDFKVNEIVVLRHRYHNVFVESLLDNTVTMRSPKVFKRISYLTKEAN